MSPARVREWAALLIFWAVAIAYYMFVVSAGHFDRWVTWTTLYDAQAQGFLAGHLRLPEEPSAILRGLPNPLDPANQKYWRWDHSYYAGHYYLYWGLAPAALLAVAKGLFHIQGTVGDEVLVFAFTVGRLVGGTLLIRALARELTRRPPAWAVWLALFVFAFASPTPFLLARGAIYEASIGAGICFTIAGLYLALRAISGGMKWSSAWGAAGGAAFGLAAASRISLLPTAAALTLFAALTVWIRARRESVHPGRTWFLVAWTAAPAALIVGAHFVVNHLRFGRWTEFGVTYQLGLPFHLAGRFIVPNAYLYLLQPGTLSCRFPFFRAPWDYARSVSPGWLPWPADYRWTEPNAGLLVVLPFAWLLVLALAIPLWRRISRIREVEQQPSGSFGVRWTIVVLCTWLFGAAAPVLVMFSLSMRYEADFATPLLLLATLAGWYLLTSARTSAARVISSVTYASLGAVTIVFGVLLGFTGYSDHFAQYNPALWTRLANTLHLCSVR